MDWNTGDHRITGLEHANGASVIGRRAGCIGTRVVARVA